MRHRKYVGPTSNHWTWHKLVTFCGALCLVRHRQCVLQYKLGPHPLSPHVTFFILSQLARTPPLSHSILIILLSIICCSNYFVTYIIGVGLGRASTYILLLSFCPHTLQIYQVSIVSWICVCMKIVCVVHVVACVASTWCVDVCRNVDSLPFRYTFAPHMSYFQGKSCRNFSSNILTFRSITHTLYRVGDHGHQDELHSNQQLQGRSKGGNDSVQRAPDPMSVQKLQI